MQDLHSSTDDPTQGKHVLDRAGLAAPTRQHELDHTDHIDHPDREPICSRKYVDHEAEIDQSVRGAHRSGWEMM